MKEVEWLVELSISEPNERLAAHYAHEAVQVCAALNLRQPFYLKGLTCRRCGAVLIPGRNCRIRFNEGRLVTTCLRCNSRRSQSISKKKF